MAGTAASLATGRLLQQFLYETAPFDPRALLGAALLLIVVAGVACLLPAWRVARARPMDVLRAE